MSNMLKPDVPGVYAQAAAKILRVGYGAGSAGDIFRKSVEIICALPGLGILPSAAGYLRGHDQGKLQLAFQLDVDWIGLRHSVCLPEDLVNPDFELSGEQLRYRFPLSTDDAGLVGLVKLFFPASAPPSPGQIELIQGLLSDIATIMAKRQVESINSHLAELAGVSPNEMYLIDAETLQIFQANQAAHIKTGFRQDQILGKPSAFLKEDISEEEYRALVQPLLDGRQNYVSFEGRQRKRDGTTYEASYRIWKLESEDGIILNEVVEDDSSHKQVLRLLQATFNSFPGGICVLDANMQMVIANNKLYELLDLPRDEFPIGCNYEGIVRYFAERGDYGDGNADEHVEERMSHARLFLEHSFERATPSGRILEFSGSPIAGGGSVITYMDITARRRVELEIRRHRDMLEEAVRQRTSELEEKSQQLEDALEHERQVNKLQRQFVSMASHEFRTPLTVIDGAAQRLARRAGAADPHYVEEKAKQIRSAVDRIVELMESILSAGKLDHGKVAINPMDCRIAEVLEETCNKRQELSPSHNITVLLEDLPETIRADRSAVDQIFTNLLSNAVKYSPGAPDIEVRGWRNGDDVKFSFRDHGLGVDEEDIPHMFERYFRARTSTGIAGTGIGLNLIKQVVELHGGHIELKSKAGVGSTFTVTLPIAGPVSSSLEGGEDAA